MQIEAPAKRPPSSLLAMLANHHFALGYSRLAGALPEVLGRSYNECGECLVARKEGWVAGVQEFTWEIYSPSLTERALARKCWGAIRDVVYDYALLRLPVAIISTAEDSALSLLRLRAMGNNCAAAADWMAGPSLDELVAAIVKQSERIVFQSTTNATWQ